MASKTPASEKAAAARNAAKENQARQRAEARRNTVLAIVGALALAAAFLTVAHFITKGGKEAGPYAVYNNGVLKAPSSEEEGGGFLVNADGVAGGTAPDDAVRIDLWMDPMCPICNAFDQAVSAELGALNEDGSIAYYVHPIAILDRYSNGTKYSTRAVSAIGTVAEHDPEHFGAVIEAYFVNQPAENTKGLTDVQIAEVLKGAGVPEDVTDGLTTGEFTEWTLAAAEQASVDGVGGTPTIRIAGVEQPFAYYYYFPRLLTYDVLVVKQDGADALADIAAERDRVLNSGATEEEGSAALEALLLQQLAELEGRTGSADGSS